MRHTQELSPSNNRQAGVALVLVLWVIALMTLMAGSFALSTQRESGLVVHARTLARATALAEGGVHYAMLMLSVPDAQKRWIADGRTYRITLGEAEIELQLYDEAGKIDLNSAQELSLRTLLGIVIGDLDRATQLTDTILDWRDPDELKHLHGAESDDYRAAGLQVMPKNRVFYVYEELAEVLGMNPELYHRLEPFLTLYSPQDGINPAKASREVLLALAGGNESLVDTYLTQKQAGLPATFPVLQGIRFHAAADSAYTVFSLIRFPDGFRYGIQTVIRRENGIGSSPFGYLTWKTLVD
ncbi:MAG: general secretion pathway protein GspK [Methylococcaceae bacterium]